MNEYPELYNESYVLDDRVMNPLAAQLEQKPRRDRGMRRGRPSISSSAFDQPSSSHLNDDDDDGNDEGTSRANVPPRPLNPQPLQSHPSLDITLSLRGLDEFSLSSGLYPSMSKSEAFFSGLTLEIKNDILMAMPFKEGTLPIKYLGIPLVSKKINVNDYVCKPKSQGDLGLKSIRSWNVALMAKHLWNVASNKDSIWVKWVKVHILKGGNIWDVELKENRSWSWCQILKLWDDIRRFFNIKIGNGQKCNIWFDKWHTRGPLNKLINHRIIFQAGLSLNARVCDFISNGSWVWPNEWEGRFDEVLDVPVPNIVHDLDDKVVWIDKKGREKHFSVAEAWKAIKTEFPKDLSCLLCGVDNESHSHLFFSCSYSKRLWERLKPMANMDNMSNIWPCVISAISNMPASNKIWSVIQRYKLRGLSLKQTDDVINASRVWNLPINKNVYYSNIVKELFDNWGSLYISLNECLKERYVEWWYGYLTLVVEIYCRRDGNPFLGINMVYFSLDFHVLKCMVEDMYKCGWYDSICIGTGFWQCNRIFDCDDSKASFVFTKDTIRDNQY
ncbi:RNA-directed DNA polymerase, eukaryota, reverse transcriptase zinc-binding domain protein [Tanacetum coccineum]